MNKLYQALRDAVVEKIRDGDFCTINDDGKYTTTIRCFDEGRKYDIVLWMGNGANSLRTYNDSDISLRFKEADKKELFDIVQRGEGNISHVRFDMLGNDLYFKANGKTIFGGYNDSNWWDNVSPAIFKKHNIKQIDDTFYQFN